MKKVTNFLSLLIVLMTFSCTKDHSNKFIGTWVKAKDTSFLEIPISLVISKSGKNFIVELIITDSVKAEIPATYDREHDKLTTSKGEIIYKPETRTILTNEGMEFRKQN